MYAAIGGGGLKLGIGNPVCPIVFITRINLWYNEINQCTMPILYILFRACLYFVLFRAQYDSRGEEISRLGSTNQILKKNQHELSRKATETEQLLQCKADECKNLELK